MRFIHIFTTTILCTLALAATAQAKHTLSGSIRDAKTGEELIGAIISVKELPNTGAASNAYGFYSLTLPDGHYTLVGHYVGYTDYIREVDLSASQTIDINLAPAAVEIKQVEVSARRTDDNVKQAQMSATKLDIKELEKVPVIFGEKDILKTIQLLPGVKSAGEGNSGFYVRGGGADQNLILLDEALVYNASHLLGFFSTFNNDALKDATLYKGNMPAEFGGKLSSVLDIKMKDGNDKTYSVGGGIGIIASRLYVEGPIVKDKGSFIITGRRTYADIFTKLSKDTTINKSKLYFYDINAKANYRVGKKDRLFLSGYFGRDKFGLGTTFGIDYGNVTTTLRWNHVVNDRIFSNLSAIYNNFSWKVSINSNGVDILINSIIQDMGLKEDLEYFLDTKNKIKFGGQSTFRIAVPGEVTVNTPLFKPVDLSRSYGWENAIYAQHEITLWQKVSLNYGLRVSSFTVTGPGKNYYFHDNGQPTDTSLLKLGQFGKTYVNPEPRLSVSYNFKKSMSLKAAYSRNTQNIHLLSNTTTSSPTDRWIMTSNNVRPEIADQVSAGYFLNFMHDMFEVSVEGYYKWMQNQIDYIPNAQLTANETVESQLVYGNGRAYGGEFFIKKRAGKWTGWISYTLSRTERRFTQVNNNTWFPARYDRTHDVAVVLMWDITPRINVSASWVYQTGNAVTYAAGKYQVNGQWVPYYPLRNHDRFPPYHRLDIGATFVLKKHKMWEHDLNVSFYNVYARQNPYQINFISDVDNTGVSKTQQISLFRIVPSLTYNFKFTYVKPQK
ncbi:MAG: TonB-dependent receptor [Bacteroidetes bacterium]|nr:TonB-dependent receptor [Bacteroidota bacterium]MBS1684355.1 TonB-dependent receptor [Bacteroidota bacterium]